MWYFYYHSGRGGGGPDPPPPYTYIESFWLDNTKRTTYSDDSLVTPANNTHSFIKDLIMNTLSTHILEMTQNVAAELDSLRNLSAMSVGQFGQDTQNEAARFNDTRLYYEVRMNKWEDYKPRLVAKLYSDDVAFFEEILESQDVTFDETHAYLTVYGECQGVETETRYMGRIPKDYRQILVDMGKIQTVQETRTALICGS